MGAAALFPVGAKEALSGAGAWRNVPPRAMQANLLTEAPSKGPLDLLKRQARDHLIRRRDRVERRLEEMRNASVAERKSWSTAFKLHVMEQERKELDRMFPEGLYDLSAEEYIAHAIKWGFKA